MFNNELNEHKPRSVFLRLDSGLHLPSTPLSITFAYRFHYSNLSTNPSKVFSVHHDYHLYVISKDYLNFSVPILLTAKLFRKVDQDQLQDQTPCHAEILTMSRTEHLDDTQIVSKRMYLFSIYFVGQCPPTRAVCVRVSTR